MSTTPRTDNAWRRYNCAGLPDPLELVKEMNALETELACEKTNRNHLIEKGAKLETELACLRAELVVEKNWVEHHSQHADDLIAENVKLRAEVERWQAEAEEMSAQRSHNANQAGRLRAEVEALKQSIESGQRVLREDAERNAARAERAEAMLAEWSVLNLWGGTPEIIHEFIKGQQNRIYHCQDLEAECLEQARLLGMSGEREADLLGKLERLAKDKARLDWLEAHALPQHSPNIGISDLGRHYNGFPGSFRAAIDAAMKP